MAVTTYYSIKLLNELCDELGIDPRSYGGIHHP
jgi:hypothetical protein